MAQVTAPAATLGADVPTSGVPVRAAGRASAGPAGAGLPPGWPGS